MEIYKDVVGYEGLYQVSNLGNVKSFKWGKVRLLKLGSDSCGYLVVNLHKNGKVKMRKIHQLVVESFLCHKPDGYKALIVDHINNNKLDNRLDNLQLVTQRHNISKDVKNVSSKYTGVCWDKSKSKWKSSIHINSKDKHLGYFPNELEAHQAYQKALSAIALPS